MQVQASTYNRSKCRSMHTQVQVCTRTRTHHTTIHIHTHMHAVTHTHTHKHMTNIGLRLTIHSLKLVTKGGFWLVGTAGVFRASACCCQCLFSFWTKRWIGTAMITLQSGTTHCHSRLSRMTIPPAFTWQKILLDLYPPPPPPPKKR